MLKLLKSFSKIYIVVVYLNINETVVVFCLLYIKLWKVKKGPVSQLFVRATNSLDL